MAHRTFTAHADQDEGVEPDTFTLSGRYSQSYLEANPDSDPTWSEDFQLIEEAPVGVLSLYQRIATTDGKGNTVWRPAGVSAFLAKVIDPNVDNGRGRFYALIDDTDRMVKLELLVDVLEWAAELLMERPFGQGSTSPPG